MFLVMSVCAQNRTDQFTRLLSEQGLPLVENYSKDNYQANNDNWSTVQDSAGILYFGNGRGVLTFNGAEWKLLILPNRPTILAMATDIHGGVFAGGVKTFGYLKNDSIGQLAYVSLIDKVPEEHRDFKSIRAIYTIANTVYFCSTTRIYCWDYQQIKVIDVGAVSLFFAVNEQLYFKPGGQPIQTILNDTITDLPNENDQTLNAVYAMTAYTDKEILIAASTGLYIYNGLSYEPLETNFSDFFEKNQIFNMLVLNDGSMVLASFYKGILFCDQAGNETFRLNADNLLASDQAFHLFQDRSGIIWATLYRGISKIEYPSPFSYFNEKNGTPDLIRKFWRNDKGLFLATGSGLFKLGKNEVKPYSEKLHFGHLTSMVSHENTLIVGGSHGLELVTGVRRETLLNGTIQTVYKSRLDSNRIFVGAVTGLSSTHKSGDKWVEELNISEVNETVLLIKEGHQGDLWISTYGNKLFWVSFASLDDARHMTDPIVTIVDENQGLPNSQRAFQEPFYIDGEIYLQSDVEDILIFNRATGRFERDKKLEELLGITNQYVRINAVDDQGNVWLVKKENGKDVDQLVAWKQQDETYKLSSLRETRWMDLRGQRPYPESKDSVVWYRGVRGAVRHDFRKQIYETSNTTLISNVSINSDSSLYHGFGVPQVPTLPYHQNQIRFEFACPSYYDEAKNSFQYYLEGFDETWSPWTMETKKDYTNINGGNYTFHVRSKNALHQISEPATYEFNITPPWYREWWMFVLYALAFMFALLGFSKWRSINLKRRNIDLEQTISDRTNEIQQKNELLRQQATRLLEMDNAKTQLYNNITHEFRTPLTVIQGMTESIKTSLDKGQIEETSVPLQMIKRNGSKLLDLVSQMLDLAKIESGNMKPQFIQADVIPYIKYVCESFHSLAQQKEVNLVIYSEIDTLDMDFDADKLSTIIFNLLSNAIKFTPKLGKIIVHLSLLQKNSDQYLSIKVKDTGIGIEATELENIFDKFYQVNDSATHEGEGTGIGLALTKELVLLMNGDIHVESSIGVGTTFFVEIPRTTDVENKVKFAELTDKQHLTSGQVFIENMDMSQTQVSNVAKPSLLIIEDNMDVAYYLRQCLESKYELTHAKNGASGIAIAFEQIPDAIISDVMMPEKDGFEVCEAIKSNVLTDHVPIILLTAKATIQDRLTGLSYGADAYLSKPFVKAELLTRLEQLVLQRQKMFKKFEQGSFSQLLKSRIDNPEAKFLQRAIRVIHEDLENPSFGSAQLARKLQLSESQVYRKLKALTDKSTAVFIRSIRLQKAKEQIQITDKSISEVAYDMGFNDPAYFSRVFKDEFGFPPSELKN